MMKDGCWMEKMMKDGEDDEGWQRVPRALEAHSTVF